MVAAAQRLCDHGPLVSLAIAADPSAYSRWANERDERWADLRHALNALKEAP